MDFLELISDIRGCSVEFDKLTDELLSQYSMFNSKDELLLCLEESNLKYENLYVVQGGIYPIWYIDEDYGVYVQIYALSKQVFDEFRVGEHIKQSYIAQKWNLNNEDYYSFFKMIPEKFRYHEYSLRYKYIPKRKLKDSFVAVYTGVDFGFDAWDEEVLEYTFSNIPKHSQSEEYVTIYRGASTRSTELEQSHSWTKSFSVAMFFATRFNARNSIIYRAKIRECDIIALLQDRDESEVICNFEDIEEVEILDIQDVNDDVISQINTDYMWTFSDYDLLIPVNVYGDGMHGLQHVRRVLLYCIILADKLGLDEDSCKILYYAAILHDCGRVDDSESYVHGRDSVKKIKEDGLRPFELSKEQEYIARRIIEYHCIPDDDGIKNMLSDCNIEDKELAIKLLKAFKDADALDRVRIRDLDYDQLRHEESRQMCLLSQYVFRNNLLI